LPVRRFVVVDAAGKYALAHPRLQEYLRAKIRLDTYQERLLADCAKWKQHRGTYALEFYARDLARLGHLSLLYELISKDWMMARRLQTNSDMAFASDVRVMIGAARQEQPPNFVQELRGSLVLATLGTQASATTPDTLAALAQSGQSERALGIAALVQDPSQRARSFALVAGALIEQGKLDEALDALTISARIARNIGDRKQWQDIVDSMVQPLQRLRAAYRNVMPEEEVAAKVVRIADVTGGKAAMRNGAIATAAATRDDTKQATELMRIALPLVRAGLTAQSLNVVGRVRDSAKHVEAICRIARELLEMGDVKAADEAIQSAAAISRARCKTRPISCQPHAQSLWDSGGQDMHSRAWRSPRSSGMPGSRPRFCAHWSRVCSNPGTRSWPAQ